MFAKWNAEKTGDDGADGARDGAGDDRPPE